MSSVLVTDDLLGDGHDRGNNGQFPVRDQYPLSLLPNEQDVLQVLLVLCVPDLSFDTIVHHVPVGRASDSQGDTFGGKSSQIIHSIAVDNPVHELLGPIAGVR